MNYQFKASAWSFAIHAAIFMIVIGISHSIPVSKPIVIDFSIGDSMDAAREDIKETPTPERQERMIKRIVKEEAKPLPAREEKNGIKQEKEPPLESRITPYISEAQVPVPASLPPKTEQAVEAKGEGRKLDARAKTDGPSTDRGTNVASVGGSENSIEKAKIRYLKEHFAYIRDLVVKNLSYPHMARRMGWSGKVTVSFVVCESGYVENIKIIESSGVGILDKNAVETIKKVSPFPKPPVKAEFIIPIVYRLN